MKVYSAGWTRQKRKCCICNLVPSMDSLAYVYIIMIFFSWKYFIAIIIIIFARMGHLLEWDYTADFIWKWISQQIVCIFLLQNKIFSTYHHIILVELTVGWLIYYYHTQTLIDIDCNLTVYQTFLWPIYVSANKHFLKILWWPIVLIDVLMQWRWTVHLFDMSFQSYILLKKLQKGKKGLWLYTHHILCMLYVKM